MEAKAKILGCILTVAVATLISLPCGAQNPAYERVGDYGSIDWIGRKVLASGVGVPGTGVENAAQTRAMAKRAAVVLARRNLLEVIKGIRIDSTTTVVDYAVKDDTVVSKIQGILNNSTVDEYAYLPNGSIKATVSMPFTGQLGEILTRVTAQPLKESPGSRISPDMGQRIQQLEDRVTALEKKLSGLKRISIDQKQQIELFKQFVQAWTDYITGGPYFGRIDYTSEKNLSSLEEKLNRQASHVTELSRRLDEMTVRLAKLESTRKLEETAVPNKPKPDVAYTGLIVDARGTDFRPCLKPDIFGLGERLYPGKYVDLQKAVRNGYVRYYRKIQRAQQSDRSGPLPFTVTAKGTYNGKGALEISPVEAEVLKTIIENSDNFMANCQVVIVF